MDPERQTQLGSGWTNGAHESIDAGEMEDARRQLGLLTAALERAAARLEALR